MVENRHGIWWYTRRDGRRYLSLEDQEDRSTDKVYNISYDHINHASSPYDLDSSTAWCKCAFNYRAAAMYTCHVAHRFLLLISCVKEVFTYQYRDVSPGPFKELRLPHRYLLWKNYIQLDWIKDRHARGILKMPGRLLPKDVAQYQAIFSERQRRTNSLLHLANSRALISGGIPKVGREALC